MNENSLFIFKLLFKEILKSSKLLLHSACPTFLQLNVTDAMRELDDKDILKQIEDFRKKIPKKNLSGIRSVKIFADYFNERSMFVAIKELNSALPNLKEISIYLSSEDFIVHLDNRQKEIDSKIYKWHIIVSDASDSTNFIQRLSNFLRESSDILKSDNIKYEMDFLITKANCYFCDDFLLIVNENKITNFDFIFGDNNFKDEQKFHLSMVFEKLGRERSFNLQRRLKFKRISDKILEGKVKKKNCLWKDDGLIVTDYNEISFCPQKEISETKPSSGSNIPFYEIDFEKQKSKIRKERCQLCSGINESDIKFSEISAHLKSALEGYLHKKRTMRVLKGNKLKSIYAPQITSPQKWEKVLIMGWYGTETTGDKAILGEVVSFLKERSPQCKIVVTTLSEKVSRQTANEIGLLKDCQIVNLRNASTPKLIEKCDAVIFGGGPIMQSNALVDIWKIFREANRQKKARIIFGCGLGPFHTKEMENIARQILQMSTSGFFRDEESLEYAKNLTPDNEFDFACDPALGYLKRIGRNATNSEIDSTETNIVTLLRANTREFLNHSTLDEYNEHLAKSLGVFLSTIVKSKEIGVKMLAMNCHYLGGDDRLFNRLVEKYSEQSGKIYVKRKYMTLDYILNSLNMSSSALAMRYHGHLFCLALSVPFISINYTGRKGKIDSLIRRIGYDEWSVDWTRSDEKSLEKKYDTLLEEEKGIKEHLSKEYRKMVLELEKVYNNIWDRYDQ